MSKRRTCNGVSGTKEAEFCALLHRVRSLGDLSSRNGDREILNRVHDRPPAQLSLPFDPQDENPVYERLLTPEWLLFSYSFR